MGPQRGQNIFWVNFVNLLLNIFQKSFPPFFGNVHLIPGFHDHRSSLKNWWILGWAPYHQYERKLRCHSGWHAPPLRSQSLPPLRLMSIDNGRMLWVRGKQCLPLGRRKCIVQVVTNIFGGKPTPTQISDDLYFKASPLPLAPRIAGTTRL